MIRKHVSSIALALILSMIAGCGGQKTTTPGSETKANNTGQQAQSNNSGSNNANSNNASSNNSGSNSGTKMVDTSKFKKDGKVKIHWASYWTGHPWMKAMGEHLEQEFAKYPNVTLTISDGQNKKEKLISDIEDAVNKKPDLLIITSGDADSPRDAAAAAVKQGIPVLSLQKVINGDEMTAKALADDVMIGREQAKSMVEALTKKNGSPKGTYAIMAGVPGASNANDRYKAYKEVLDQYPEIKKVADQPANWRRDQGRSLMENWIQSDQKIDAVISMADEMTIGAGLAIRDAKKQGQYILISANAQTEALQMIKSGEIYSSYATPDAVDQGVELALKLLKGESIPYIAIVNGQMVDQKNVDEALNDKCFVFRGSDHKKHTKDPNGC